jgi:predicted exporter
VEKNACVCVGWVEPWICHVAGQRTVAVMHRHQKLLAPAKVQREVLETLCMHEGRVWEGRKR